MAVQPLEAGDPAEVAGYRMRGRLGAGGMGRVYLAYTPAGRPVAVKVMRPELGDDPEFRARFGQEIAAARRVSGLFTAQVLDADPGGSPPWLATAYVPGPSLAKAVADHGPVPVQSLLLLVAGVAEALQAIHAAGLVHRDLKPSNVLLAADGPRVIDFGIARAAEATGLTQTGMLVGSPQFMAPEQIRGGAVPPAADVFALGALASYAATGRAPFGGGDAAVVMFRVLHQDPDLDGCPGPLRAMLQECLAKDGPARPSPARIIEFCRGQAAAGTLEFTQSWLPSAIAADLASHAAPAATAAQPGASAQAADAAPPAPATPQAVPPAPGPPAAGPPESGPPGAWPAGTRAVPDAANPQRRHRRSRTAVIAGAAVAVLAVALAGYGVRSLTLNHAPRVPQPSKTLAVSRPKTFAISQPPKTPAGSSTPGHSPTQPPATTPAAPVAPAPPPVFVAGQYRGIKPSEIGFSGDSGNAVGSLTWSKWTATGATGSGTSGIDDCNPDCADGKTTMVPATITLSRPVNGEFRVITETRNGTTSTGTWGSGSWPEDAQP